MEGRKEEVSASTLEENRKRMKEGLGRRKEGRTV